MSKKRLYRVAFSLKMFKSRKYKSRKCLYQKILVRNGEDNDSKVFLLVFMVYKIFIKWYEQNLQFPTLILENS